MPTLGVSELLVIFMILLVVFGASRLPALGEGLGRAFRGFKRGSNQDESIQVSKPAPEQEQSAARGSGTPSGSPEAEDAEVGGPKA